MRTILLACEMSKLEDVSRINGGIGRNKTYIHGNGYQMECTLMSDGFSLKFEL
jgi:hypothetical protein